MNVLTIFIFSSETFVTAYCPLHDPLASINSLFNTVDESESTFFKFSPEKLLKAC